MATFVGNGTKANIPSEIIPPLTRTLYTYLESRYLGEYANEVKLKYLPELVHLANWQSTVVAQYLASAKWWTACYDPHNKPDLYYLVAFPNRLVEAEAVPKSCICYCGQHNICDRNCHISSPILVARVLLELDCLELELERVRLLCRSRVGGRVGRLAVRGPQQPGVGVSGVRRPPCC